VAGTPGRDGKPANFENLKPQAIEQSGIRGIASRHGYEVRRTGRVLYDLRNDPGETRDVSAEHPEVVKRLEALAEKARADLGDAITGRKGTGLRPVGRR
jgi:arylsulfatase